MGRRPSFPPVSAANGSIWAGYKLYKLQPILPGSRWPSFSRVSEAKSSFFTGFSGLTETKRRLVQVYQNASRVSIWPLHSRTCRSVGDIVSDTQAESSIHEQNSPGVVHILMREQFCENPFPGEGMATGNHKLPFCI